MAKKTKIQTTKQINQRTTLNEQYGYETINWILPSDLKDHYLLNCPTICVDIETQTETADENWAGKMFGTSYVADITIVAIHAEGYPTCVIDFMLGENPEPDGEMYGCEGVAMTINQQYDLRKEFIKKVLTRPGITIIGHNVVFDLRALGGHFGFNLLQKDHARVWDTMTMGNLLLISVVGEQMKLEYAAQRFNLIGDDEAKQFYYKMKDVRFELHTALTNDVMRYGAMDTQVTYRYYQMQNALIESSPNKDVEPTSVWEDGVWSIKNEIVTGRPNQFVSIKNYANLPTLVDWETRKLWVAACMAISGMKLDVDLVMNKHREYTEAYAQSLTDLMEMLMHDPTHSEQDNWTIPFLIWHYWPKDVDADDWVYGKLFFGQSPDDFTPDEEVAYLVSDEAINKVSPWLPSVDRPALQLEDGAEEGVELDDVQIEEAHRLAKAGYKKQAAAEEARLMLLMVAGWMYDHTQQFQDDPDGGWKASVKAGWYIRFMTERKQIDPIKLMNRASFKMYYVFVLQNITPASNEEMVHASSLLTPKLKKQFDKGDDKDDERDWRTEAMLNHSYSMSDDALKYYFGDEDEEDTEIDPLRKIGQNSAKVSRIDEFLRHAGRDGKVHSVVAPKASTSRATHVTMNIGNLPMLECRGYLVVDDPTKKVQASIDLSNAENWFSGLTFADNAQAEACASGDYHLSMTEIYHYRNPDGSFTDEYIEMRREIAAGTDKGKEYAKKLKAQRKGDKKITFGRAYGAGAPRIARETGMSYEGAKQLITNAEIRFAATTQGKIDLQNRITNMYNKGFNPPFCNLWTGRRVPIDLIWDRGRIKVRAFAAVNYVQQGGVAEVVWRAMVEAQEEAIERGLSLQIVNQVHDEIVFQADIPEYWECAEIIIRFLSSQIPQEFLNRTIPACRMLAALGPENADKWGYDTRVEYPIDKTIFLNQWGIHKLENGETEAPTWQGNLDEGYTVEKEIIERTLASARVSDDNTGVDMTKLPTWAQFTHISNQLLDRVRRIEELRTPVTVTVNDKELGPFLLPERMAVLSTMQQRGHVIGNEYAEVWDNLGALVDSLRDYTRWFSTYSPVATPKERKAQENQYDA